MSALVDDVRREVVDLHVFFTAWFNGTADRSELDARFISRLHPDLIFVPPEGKVMQAKHLRAGFEHAYGTNPDFKIQIRDVAVRFESGEQVLATYTEWQIGAKASAYSNNARFSSVLLNKGNPFQWLHIQETWLPEEVRTADPFDF